MHEIRGIYWTEVDQYADGSLFAGLYRSADPDRVANYIATVHLPAGSTPQAVYEALRVQICKIFKLPQDTAVVNHLGWKILVGGSCGL